MPLIGETAHGKMAGIIVLTVWPIRGDFVPHENGGKLTLASLFWVQKDLGQNAAMLILGLTGELNLIEYCVT